MYSGVLGHFFPDVLGKDWFYFRINRHASVELVPAGPGIYELIAIQTATHFLPIINTKINSHDGFATNDLLEKHPEKEGFWRIYGRADDQITLANGYKTNPGPIEAALCEDSKVKAALLFGRAQTHVGALVFPTEHVDPADAEGVLRFRDHVWPTVERVNATVPKHSQIFKQMILVASPSKPLLYTEKHTVRKGATLQQYDEEIKTMYILDDADGPEHLIAPESWTLTDAKNFVRATVRQYAPTVTSDSQDLFEHGCTSLHALWIGNTIIQALQLSREHRSRNFVYRHPTVDSLSDFVFGLAQGRTSPNSEEAQLQASRAARMFALVEQLSSNLPPVSQGAPVVDDRGKAVVIVTGTTGALGANVLAKLLGAEDVAQVYSLDRTAPDGVPLARRLEESLEKRCLDPRLLLSPKLTSLEADFTVPGLGLPDDTQQELRTSVTHVLHLGWPVNFNLALESFGDALEGLRELVNFALASATRPRLVFASSAGIFQGPGSVGPVLEQPIHDPSAIAELGYTESKWVAEQVLARAAKTRGLQTQVVRLGQLTGGAGGCWDTKEWVPALVRTSIFLKCLPRLSGDAQWLPLDCAAAAIIEARDAPHDILHLVHPDPVPLSSMMEMISEELSLQLCSYDEWLGMLEKHAAADAIDEAAAQELPALKALDFFRGLRSAGTADADVRCGNAAQASGSLGRARRLGAEDVKAWVEYWKAVGFF
ncbi:uncharacterized protein PHACADRAFT_211550 [Phanerochaete carnosa HHB-10118-sp]|uniref:Thioester reductase (TE) domain-containing protein n=1 Tax=Phanerochaete carnosa (strain HHB-10118-sp) TaxID=650164 RepID=K5VLI6_PHACS|nr:uncharacterized protein PHACADRAFT_211550 [Phanerochaete carnosa HHB-10118-sp]EKM52278.1 hypothetical protein PHACADRAFT_211550 [Phanerochaete carnosa HHB-10118-sp]